MHMPTQPIKWRVEFSPLDWIGSTQHRTGPARLTAARLYGEVEVVLGPGERNARVKTGRVGTDEIFRRDLIPK